MAIDMKTLTHCKVVSDGATIELHFIDGDGQRAVLNVPFDNAHVIAMTLPRLLTEAVCRKTDDPTARYIFPLGAWQVDCAADRSCAIATLSTRDGFSVSFGIPFDTCRSFGWALRDEAEQSGLMDDCRTVPAESRWN